MKLDVPEYIKSIKPYEPGKPIEELEREYNISNSVKLASNENPLGPSPLAIKAIREGLLNVNRYPDGSGFYLTKKIAEKLSVEPGAVVLGNGSDDIIGILTKALLVPGDEAIMPDPSFLMYEISVKSSGARPIKVPLCSLSIDLMAMADRITPRTKIVFITNPHNPTGTAVSREEFEKFIRAVPETVAVVVDEAYIEFMQDRNGLISLEYLKSGKNVVVLRTFSKAYGLAGLRIGYGVMPEPLAGVLHRIRQPFNVNSLALIAAEAALDDVDFLARTLEVVHRGLEFLYVELDAMGLKYFKTQANFFLIDLDRDADEIFKRLLGEGIIVRSMRSYGYREYIRVNAGREEENMKFIEALKKVMD